MNLDFTMLQLTFNKQTFNTSTSKTSSQSEYHNLTLDMRQDLIQVRVDMQAASKVADEKRKHDVIAFKNFRQRRKEKSLKIVNETSNLKAQLRKMIEEQDFSQNVLLQNNILIIKSCLTFWTAISRHWNVCLKRRQKHLKTQQYICIIARAILIYCRCSFFFERMIIMSFKHIQMLQQRTLSQVLSHSNIKSFNVTTSQQIQCNLQQHFIWTVMYI